MGALTPAGAMLSTGAGILGLFANNQDSSPVGGTIEDQAFMDNVSRELRDVNITRFGQDWGIRVPFDEEYTIYVWFDALLNYITAIGYGQDEELFRKWWPADIHFIGKDITRFHCALWPAMCFAAGIEPPRLGSS